MLHLLNIDKWKKVALVIVYCELDIGHLSIWNNAMIYLNDDRQTEVNFIESAIYEQYHLDLTILKLIAEPSKILEDCFYPFYPLQVPKNEYNNWVGCRLFDVKHSFLV